MRETNDLMNDNDLLNKKVDEWIKKMDDIK